jgi:hypothetical protein
MKGWAGSSTTTKGGPLRRSTEFWRTTRRRERSASDEYETPLASKGRPVRIWSRAPYKGRPSSARLRGRCGFAVRRVPDGCRFCPPSPIRSRRAGSSEVYRCRLGPHHGHQRRTGRASPRSGRGSVARRGSRLRLRSVSAVWGPGEQSRNGELRRKRIESDPLQGRSARPTRTGRGPRPSPYGMMRRGSLKSSRGEADAPHFWATCQGSSERWYGKRPLNCPSATSCERWPDWRAGPSSDNRD